jgi:IS4 transposase
MTRRLGKQTVSIYRTRMQIEEEFKVMKSSAFGLGFEQSRSRLLRRLKILILQAILASLTLLIIGLPVIQSNAHMRYQANTKWLAYLDNA